MSIVTKEGVTVKVGQVWRDLDVRNLPRTVQVTDVSGQFNKAVVKNTKTGKHTALAISRMHKTATGWVLVSEPEA